MTEAKTYLGNGVYAEPIDRAGSILLTVRNGGEDGVAEQEIYLEPDTLRKLIKFAAIPVVKTCGACSWSNDSELCQHPKIIRGSDGCRYTDNRQYGRGVDGGQPRSLSSKPPPDWCPLRGKP